jgi:hypothetical protein
LGNFPLDSMWKRVPWAVSTNEMPEAVISFCKAVD